MLPLGFCLLPKMYSRLKVELLIIRPPLQIRKMRLEKSFQTFTMDIPFRDIWGVSLLISLSQTPMGCFRSFKDNDGYHLEYTSINVIRNYEQAGIYVNWVVFEPYETGTYGTDGTMYPFQNESNVKASKKYERFRAIDKKFRL